MKTAEIPTGARGTPLGQGHIEAHVALVEHVLALEGAVADLTHRLEELESKP